MMRIPVRRLLLVGAVVGTFTLGACASSPTPVMGPSAPEALSPRPSRQALAAQGGVPSAPPVDTEPVAAASPALSMDEADPEEAQDPATLEPLLAKGQRPSFSKRTIGERECWQAMALTGEARQDYAALVERCGKPTGSLEYARPAVGRLDHTYDKSDTFIVFLRAGLCYRFFGVGDATIPDLDILIERNGALQGEDRTHGSVAIINTDEAWCMDSDAEYRFLVQVSGEGHGRYVFGVWARPRT
jgi:hypothetical protein